MTGNDEKTLILPEREGVPARYSPAPSGPPRPPGSAIRPGVLPLKRIFRGPAPSPAPLSGYSITRKAGER